MDILHELGRTPPQGPFGALRSGDASEPVRHFPEYDRLHPEGQATVNRVWSGQQKKCLVMSFDGRAMFYVEYTPAGQERAGIRYGYTVRSVAVTNHHSPGLGDARMASGTRPLKLVLFVICAAGVTAGSGIAGWELAHRQLVTQAAGSPVVSSPTVHAAPAKSDSDEMQKKFLEIERRERKVADREARMKKDESTEVTRLRAIIESEAEECQSRASLLRARLTGTAQNQDKVRPTDPKQTGTPASTAPGPGGLK